MTLTILKTEPFQPLGPAIPKPAPAAPQPVQIKPGIWQAPDGKLRTDFATGQSVAPAQKTAPETPLTVVPNALGDGWIAWGGGTCPVVRRTKVEIHFREESRIRPDINNPTDRPEDLRWSHGEERLACWDIVAYRLIP
jgi:hypothetical protein